MLLPKRSAFKLFVAGFCALGRAIGVAQSVVIPPVSSPTPDQNWQQVNTPAVDNSQSQVVPETESTAGAAEIKSIASSLNRLITPHPHLSYGFTYGNGIQSQPGSPQTTIIQSVSPGIGLDIGKDWKLDYTPSLTFYSDKNFHNSLNQNVGINGSFALSEWRMNLSQVVSLSSDPQIQTGLQTDQQAYATTLTAGYQINEWLSCDLSALQDFTSVGGFTNSVGNTRAWSTMDWLNYHWGPFGSGVGFGLGYNEVELGANNNLFEMYQGNFSWHVLRKLTLFVNGGAQVYQFLESSQPNMTTPIFGASLTYTPFEHTIITLNANHTESASTYFIDQFTESTGLSGSLSQRLVGRVSLGLAGGYSKTSFHTSVPIGPIQVFSVTRKDNTSFLTVGLSTSVLKRGSVSVSYAKSWNNSNSGGFSFASDQFGFQVSCAF